MAYQLKHLQFTVDYITNQLKYANVDYGSQSLTKSDKKWVSNALLQALDPIQNCNPKVIVINPDNKKLNSYFEYLAKNNILYPEKTTYLLKRNGESFECSNENKIEIYNRHKMKHKKEARRTAELTERLREISLDDGYPSEELDVEEAYPTYTPQHSAIRLSPFQFHSEIEPTANQTYIPFSKL